MDSSAPPLKELVDRWTARHRDPQTAIEGLSLHRVEQPGEPVRHTREAALCLIVQGSKRVVFGSEVLLYDQDHALLATIDLPVVAQVLEASVERPYLSLTLKLESALVAELLANPDLPPLPRAAVARSIRVSPLPSALASAVARLVALLDEPEHVPVLAPLYKREILYRLLLGDMGADLRALAAKGTPAANLSKALEWLKRNFAEPVRVDELAASSNMSPTTFHHHFRLMTAMSPLQYQKWLRLQEARRLMLSDHLEASQAAYRVGYESASQFSREYRRLFDAPPARDVLTLRQAPAVAVEQP